jgi:hypothetical protein
MMPLDRDVADQPFRVRHSRWRGWLRVHTPDLLFHRLGFIMPKARDCGDHDWYKHGRGIDACYHCRVTRATPVINPGSDTEPTEGPGPRRVRIVPRPTLSELA